MAKLIITIKEARRILGKSYDKYPDSYIKQLIVNIDSIATAFIKSVPRYEE